MAIKAIYDRKYWLKVALNDRYIHRKKRFNRLDSSE